MRRPSLLRGALMLTVGLPLLINPPLAFPQEDDDPDAKAYSSHTLTMPKLKKSFAASVNLANAGQRNPEVKKVLQTVLDGSLDEGVAHFNRIPEARRAVADAGLTPREFVLTFWVAFGAKMANDMVKKQRMAPAAAAEEAGITPTQFAFYRKNEATIARLEKEAEAKIARLEKEAEAKDPVLKIDKAQETGAAQSE